MNMRRLSITMLAAGALVVGSALPAAAHGDHGDHQSCQGFGAFFADFAQGGYEDDWNMPNPGLGSFATLGPGVIADTIEVEHDLFC